MSEELPDILRHRVERVQEVAAVRDELADDFVGFVGGEQYFGRQYSHHGLVGSMLTR